MFLATILLHSPRLVDGVGVIEQLLLLPALAVLLAPAMMAPDEINELRYVLAHAAGLFFVEAWVARYLHLYAGYEDLVAHLVLALACVGLAGSRMLVLSLLARSRTHGVTRVCVVAMTLCAADLLMVEIFKWYEPLSFVFACAEAFGMPQLISHLGTNAVTPLVVLAAVVLCVAPLEGTTLLGGTTLAVVVSLGYATAPVHEVPVVLVGVQSPAADTEASRLIGEALHDREAHPAETIVVLPEGACRGRCRTRLGDVQVSGYIESWGFGQHRHRYNGVVVERHLSATETRELGTHVKQNAAPLGEGRRIETTERRAAGPAVHGINVALPICYEIFDRKLVSTFSGGLGISVSADAYDASGSASTYMSKAAWVRALEFGIPFVRVSETVGSAAFSPRGEVLAHLERGEGVMVVVLGLGSAPRAAWTLPPWLLGLMLVPLSAAFAARIT